MNKRDFFIAAIFWGSCLGQASGQPTENGVISPKEVKLPFVNYDAKLETRNPFYATVLPPKQQAQDLSKVPPLERYELNQYRLTATVQDDEGNYRGNLVDPNNKGYLVAIGTKVGHNGGAVISVDENKVVVQEQKVDLGGEKTITHEFVLKRKSSNE